MGIYDGYNNGYNNSVYNAHKNMGVHYTQQNMVKVKLISKTKQQRVNIIFIRVLSITATKYISARN